MTPKSKGVVLLHSCRSRCGLSLLGTFPVPLVHFLWCWSMHSSSDFLLAGTLLLLQPVHEQFLLFFSLCSCCFAVCGELFADLAEQWRQSFVGGLDVGKINFSILLFVLCIVFLFFLFSSLAHTRRQLQCNSVQHKKGGRCVRAVVTGRIASWDRTGNPRYNHSLVEVPLFFPNLTSNHRAIF